MSLRRRSRKNAIALTDMHVPALGCDAAAKLCRCTSSARASFRLSRHKLTLLLMPADMLTRLSPKLGTPIVGTGSTVRVPDRAPATWKGLTITDSETAGTFRARRI
jgi:hypothetical protein